MLDDYRRINRYRALLCETRNRSKAVDSVVKTREMMGAQIRPDLAELQTRQLQNYFEAL